ncbi:lipolytic protein [Legionella lansingensis]|uniref:Lipolytic enzyme n=1 Tax=Legionella lansingensis TaxID=45067 RepID=A0A0W0VGQ0_9GAMM|nr:alpha/beta hydrolase [Legionella lansingensis]KTD19349.1 lipolytic enzyme [Legionella lansingensis]SNV52962.1 lipolytic protein [Legionella lansingensis]
MSKELLQKSFILIVLGALSLLGNMALALTKQVNNFISYSDSGHGQPLILIHAFPTDKQLWQLQQPLSEKFRVITLDLWGFGESARADGQAIAMADYADEVNQLMDQLNLDKAIIVGESMGGYITLAFLAKYPHKVKGLVLSNTQAIADSEETKAKRETIAVDVLEHGTMNFIKGFMPKALSSNAQEHLKEFLYSILARQEPTGLASALRGMALRPDTLPLLAKCKLPILIITGSEDSLISPQQSETMHLLATNSKLIVLADAGHLSNLEQPQQWNQAVIDMFAKS